MATEDKGFATTEVRDVRVAGPETETSRVAFRRSPPKMTTAEATNALSRHNGWMDVDTMGARLLRVAFTDRADRQSVMDAISSLGVSVADSTKGTGGGYITIQNEAGIDMISGIVRKANATQPDMDLTAFRANVTRTEIDMAAALAGAGGQGVDTAPASAASVAGRLNAPQLQRAAVILAQHGVSVSDEGVQVHDTMDPTLADASAYRHSPNLVRHAIAAVASLSPDVITGMITDAQVQIRQSDGQRNMSSIVSKLQGHGVQVTQEGLSVPVGGPEEARRIIGAIETALERHVAAETDQASGSLVIKDTNIRRHVAHTVR